MSLADDAEEIAAEPLLMKPEYLLVTDLDGTLLGDDVALQAFRRHREALPAADAIGLRVGTTRRGCASADCGTRPLRPRCDHRRRRNANRILRRQSVTDWCRPSARILGCDAIRVTACRSSTTTRAISDGVQSQLLSYRCVARRFSRIANALVSSRNRGRSDLQLRIAISTSCRTASTKGPRQISGEALADSRRAASSSAATAATISRSFKVRFRGVVVANCLPELRQLDGDERLFLRRRSIRRRRTPRNRPLVDAGSSPSAERRSASGCRRAYSCASILAGSI